MMVSAILNALVCLIPLVVLWSGMAMNPVFLCVVLLVALLLPRSAYLTLKTRLAAYAPVPAAIAAVFAWALLSALWSIDPSRSVNGTITAALAFAAGLFAMMHASVIPAPTPRHLRWFAGGIIVSSLIVLSEKIPGGGLIHALLDFAGIEYKRFMDKTINRGLCALVLFCWPLVGGLCATGQRRLAWASVLSLLAAVLVMHSLSAKVGMVAALVTFAALRLSPVWLPRLLVVAVPAFLMAVPVGFTLLEHKLFGNAEVRAHMPESSLQRLGIWHELLLHAEERPLLGWGMDVSRVMPVSDFAHEELGWQAPPLHPHNSSLQVMQELGIMGLCIIATAVGLALAHWRSRMAGAPAHRRAASGALAIAYVGAGLSSFGIWQSWWIASLWLAVFLMHYLPRAATR